MCGLKLRRRDGRLPKALPTYHQSPGNARHFVGERDDNDLRRSTFLKAPGSSFACSGTSLGEADYFACANVEQMRM